MCPGSGLEQTGKTMRTTLKSIIVFVSLCYCFCHPLSAVASGYINMEGRNNQKILSGISLPKKDIRLYQRIFKAIRNNDFTAAQELSRKLNNKLLLGHIQAQIYLSASYPTSYTELQDWLEHYSDHPQASRIYNLALRKGSAEGLSIPHHYVPTAKKFSVYNWPYTAFEKLSGKQLAFLENKLKLFRRSIQSGKTKAARQVLENKQVQKSLPPAYYSDLANTLAMKYLTDNYNLLAYNWGQQSVRKKPNATGYWISGIAAWRRHQYQNAVTAFKKTAETSLNDPWMTSAGAYWAARSYQRLKNTSSAGNWFKKASRHKRTFYGILAAKQLGITPQFNWDTVSYLNDFSSDGYLQELLASAPIRRAIALIYAQEEELAELELRCHYEELSPRQKEAALFLARHYQMHSLGIMISNRLCDDKQNITYDHTAYPIPQWKPTDGWKMDKALLLALTRQESSFRPYVTSPAGACGLMQLLPSTAAYISKDLSLRRNKTQLLEAEYNLNLGQQYVAYLMNKEYINGNLLYMMTAYNAGPGNLYKWQKTIADNNDPLLFMEVVPSKETRIYLERVMANYWIYQIRLGKASPTLDALAQGHWPVIKR